MATMRLRYANGVLTPLEPIALEEGAELTVTVMALGEASSVAPSHSRSSDEADQRRDQGPKETSLQRIARRIEERREQLPPDAWDDLPTDLVKNKKHYLYGHPREDD